MAAHQLIPNYWKTLSLPSFSMWTSNVYDFQCIEALVALDIDDRPDFGLYYQHGYNTLYQGNLRRMDSRPESDDN